MPCCGWDISSRLKGFNDDITTRHIGYDFRGTNSNWALRCWMRNCDITLNWKEFNRNSTPGWDCDAACPPTALTNVPPPPTLDSVPLPADITDERLRLNRPPARNLGLDSYGDPLPDYHTPGLPEIEPR
jgi:hypothetical protein